MGEINSDLLKHMNNVYYKKNGFFHVLKYVEKLCHNGRIVKASAEEYDVFQFKDMKGLWKIRVCNLDDEEFVIHTLLESDFSKNHCLGYVKRNMYCTSYMFTETPTCKVNDYQLLIDESRFNPVLCYYCLHDVGQTSSMSICDRCVDNDEFFPRRGEWG